MNSHYEGSWEAKKDSLSNTNNVQFTALNLIRLLDAQKALAMIDAPGSKNQAADTMLCRFELLTASDKANTHLNTASDDPLCKHWDFLDSLDMRHWDRAYRHGRRLSSQRTGFDRHNSTDRPRGSGLIAIGSWEAKHAERMEPFLKAIEHYNKLIAAAENSQYNGTTVHASWLLKRAKIHEYAGNLGKAI